MWIRRQKESTYATIFGPDGEIVPPKIITNEKVPSFLRPHDVERVAIEAFTRIAPLYWKLAEDGCEVTARIKSDRIDSRASALCLI